MTEMDPGLTGGGEATYSRSGDTFMNEGAAATADRAPAATRPEARDPFEGRPHRELTPEEAQNYWERFERSRGGLNDQDIARRNAAVAGTIPTQVFLDEQGNDIFPGIDAEGINDPDALREVRAMNQYHDTGREVSDNMVLDSIRRLTDKRSQLQEELAAETDPIQRRMREDEIRQVQAAINRIGRYASARSQRRNEDIQLERKARNFSAEDVAKILRGPDSAREELFESIFAGVDARPGTEYRSALGLEAGSKLDEFMTLLNEAEFEGDEIDVAKERDKLHNHYSTRQSIREFLHNANWAVGKGGGDIQEFAKVMSTAQSEYVDTIFTDPLVGTAVHMFEQAFMQIRAENNGQLPYEKLVWNEHRKDSTGDLNPGNELEDRVWALMRRVLESGVIKDERGNPIRTVAPWRFKRAIVWARGWGVASLRFPEIAAEARLPEEDVFSDSTTKAKRFGSIYGEAIARYLDPFEHIIEKFNISGEHRALLYFFLTGDKSKFQSKEQLREALEMKSHLEGKDKRFIDIINLFRTGGPFSRTSWRTQTAMENVETEDIRNFGLAIREVRLSGDVSDELTAMERELVEEQMGAEIRQRVSEDPKWRRRSDEEKEGEVNRRIAEEIKERLSHKDEETKLSLEDQYKLDKRLGIWDDALKTNPLRVMWIWDQKSPGKRVTLLSESLGITEGEALSILPQVEEDIMIIQEDASVRMSRHEVDLDVEEVLDYDLITEEGRRGRAHAYIAAIRREARDDNYKRIKDLFEQTKVEGGAFPFVIGMEDIPFNDLEFVNAGGRGVLARRMNDFANAATAANELVGLLQKIPTTHEIKPLIESLDAIKKAVENYDLDIALDINRFIAEGVIRVYDKKLLARLPLGIGTIIGLEGKSSFAQEVLGREAMAWDETDKFNFTRHLRLNELVRGKDVDDLRKAVGATYTNVAIDAFRTYGQLVLMLLAFQFAKSVVEEKR